MSSHGDPIWDELWGANGMLVGRHAPLEKSHGIAYGTTHGGMIHGTMLRRLGNPTGRSMRLMSSHKTFDGKKSCPWDRYPVRRPTGISCHQEDLPWDGLWEMDSLWDVPWFDLWDYVRDIPLDILRTSHR